jgi:hypothetical protein
MRSSELGPPQSLAAVLSDREPNVSISVREVAQRSALQGSISEPLTAHVERRLGGSYRLVRPAELDVHSDCCGVSSAEM